jgi:hypothetical protein
MALRTLPNSVTTLVMGIFGAIIGAIGYTAFTSHSDLLYLGSQATGQTIYPADPVSGDYITLGGRNYVVYRTNDDAGQPDTNGVNCSADACLSAAGCGAQVVAAVNADPSGKVYAGIDGGVGVFLARDAGMAANRPIVWYSRTREITTDTDTDTLAATATFSATATDTETETALITATGTGTATDDSWTTTGTGTGTASFTGSLTETVTVTGTVTLSNSVVGTYTASATDTAEASNTWSGTGTGTATETVTGEGTDVSTGSATVTVTATVAGTATVTGSATVTGTGTSTYTVTSSTTSSGTSTGMSTGKDPVATGGPILGIVGNSFNPATSGLNAPVGSQVRTVDETKAWLKVGTATTAWTPINTF